MNMYLTVKYYPHRDVSDEQGPCDEAKLAKDKFEELNQIHK